ncbi:MAG: hypothetical protein ACRDKB_14220 [Actinomycetota bacterium]
MTGRILAIVTMAAVGAWGTMLPAGAQDPPPEPPPEVPEVVQIEDPEGDANYQGDDQTTPADLSVSDLLRVWFTNDEETITVHIQTEVPPPSSNASYVYRVNTNPGDAEDGCLEWEAIVEGPTWVGESFGRLDDECSGDDFEPIEGELEITEASDESGLITVTIPRDAHEALAKGSVIDAPWARVLNNTGAESRLVGPTVDDTQVGSDYEIQDEKKKKKKKKRRQAREPRALIFI